MEEKIKLGKYAVRFGIIYLLLLIGVAVVLGIFDIESNSGVSMGALMGSAVVAAIKFVQDHKRPPTKSEKYRLSLMSLLAGWVVSAILTSIYLLAGAGSTEILETVKSTDLILIVVIVAVLSAIYLCALLLSYGYLATKQYEAMLKQGKI